MKTLLKISLLLSLSVTMWQTALLAAPAARPLQGQVLDGQQQGGGKPAPTPTPKPKPVGPPKSGDE